MTGSVEHGDAAPAKNPCGSCPYRQDAPSGLWAPEEYDKLPQYDLPTFEQPARAFFCHQQDGRLCAGWVGCHDMDNSLGLRMAVAFGLVDERTALVALDYVSPVPLWESGQQAYEHDVRDIAEPGTRARRTIRKLMSKRAPGD